MWKNFLKSKLFNLEHECLRIRKLNEKLRVKSNKTNAHSKETCERLIAINNNLNAKIESKMEILNIKSIIDCLIKDLNACLKENADLKNSLKYKEVKLAD